MVDAEWTRMAIEAAGWAASSLVGLGLGLWRGGRRSAMDEQKVREEFNAAVAGLERRIEEKLDRSAGQFDETLKGLRQKINDVELDAVRTFVAKPDFDEFRKEYRRDQDRVDQKLDRLLGKRQ